MPTDRLLLERRLASLEVHTEMLRRLLIASLWVVPTAFAEPPASPDGGVSAVVPLWVGQTRLLGAGLSERTWRTRWSVGDQTLVSVSERGDLELRGERPGSTTLEVWFNDGSSRRWVVHVEPRGDGEIRLGVGSQKVLSVAQVGKLTVSDAGVVRVKPIGNKQLLLVGVAEGVAMLEVERGAEPPLRYLVTVVRPPIR